MKLKGEIKLKGSGSEVRERFEALLQDLEEQACDRFTIKIKYKAGTEPEKKASEEEAVS